MLKPTGQTRFQVLVEALASGADLFDETGEWGATRDVSIDLDKVKQATQDGKARRSGGKGLVLDALELKTAQAGEERMDVEGGDDGIESDEASDDDSDQGDVGEGADMDAMQGFEGVGDASVDDDSDEDESDDAMED